MSLTIRDEECAATLLRMMRALVSILIDDSENEPPDFTVTDDDDVGLGEA